MTPHIEATIGEYADIVLMPGDPLRAKFIAHTFLDNVVCVNTVRNCLGFTGFYKGKRVSVQASGMGQPSIGIYATELFKFYGVEKIIRVGTCGSLQENIKCGDIVVAINALTENSNIISKCCDLDIYINVLETLKDSYTCSGTILSTDTFYHDNSEWYVPYKKQSILAVDMETYILYNISSKMNKKALTVNLVSDNVITKESLSFQERVTRVEQMTEYILESL